MFRLMFTLGSGRILSSYRPHMPGLSSLLLLSPTSRNHLSKMSSDSHWLSPAEREEKVMELRSTGWMEVEDRDAIFKELHFKSFNQSTLNPGAQEPRSPPSCQEAKRPTSRHVQVIGHTVHAEGKTDIKFPLPWIHLCDRMEMKSLSHHCCHYKEYMFPIWLFFFLSKRRLLKYVEHTHVTGSNQQ
uniref:Pterin-4-alpha-carbinolamine dehydratase 2 n=1 Tax=Cynoglossus semilaevis TaxID=244447 RepID=A0A3P8WHX5_CYNSE